MNDETRVQTKDCVAVKLRFFRPRFTLAALLLLITVLAIPLGFAAQRRAWNLQRKAAYERLDAKRVNLGIDDTRCKQPDSLWSAWKWLTRECDTPLVTSAKCYLKYGPHEKRYLSAADLGLLVYFPELERIELKGETSLDDDALSFLAQLPNLRELKLWRLSNVRGEFLTRLASYPKLEALTLQEIDKLDGRNLSKLAQAKLLRSLRITGCPELNDLALSDVNLPPSLETLEIEGSIGEETLVRWLKSCRVKNLSLDTPITGETLQELKSHVDLETLKIVNAPYSDDDLKFLSEFRKLDSLSLCSMPLEGRILTWFPEGATLKRLSFDNTLFADERMSELPRFTELEYVSLGSTPISGEGFKSLEELPKNCQFCLWGARFSDAGKAAFANCLNDQYASQIYLPSNWNAEDMLLLKSLKSKNITFLMSDRWGFEGDVQGPQVMFYLPNNMIRPPYLTSMDRCPVDRMAPVTRLHALAKEDLEILKAEGRNE